MSSNNEMCVPESAPTITTNSNSLIVYLIALGAFALGMASYVTAGLIPLIEQSFGVSVGVAAQLVTAFTLAYGIGSPIVVALLLRIPANVTGHSGHRDRFAHGHHAGVGFVL